MYVNILDTHTPYNRLTLRMPLGKGIAGTVATTGEVINVSNAYKDSRFNQDIDKNTGYKANAILTMPIKTASGGVIAVVQFINKVLLSY